MTKGKFIALEGGEGAGKSTQARLLAEALRARGLEVVVTREPGGTAGAEAIRALLLGTEGDGWHPRAEALLFAAAGELVPTALADSLPGATIVCAGIHMSDIPSFQYRLLWQERVVRSVANLTRRDGEAFFAEAARTPLTLHTTGYALADANRALDDLRSGRLTGAAVLHCGGGT